jgi:hypothetical protein
MPYLVAAVVAILVTIKLVQVIKHAITKLSDGIDAAGHGLAASISNGAADTWQAASVVLLWIAWGGLALVGVWALAWLVSEGCYLVRDRRNYDAWLLLTGHHVAVALATPGPWAASVLPPPPPRPGIGDRRDHPLSLRPPLPRVLREALTGMRKDNSRGGAAADVRGQWRHFRAAGYASAAGALPARLHVRDQLEQIRENISASRAAPHPDRTIVLPGATSHRDTGLARGVTVSEPPADCPDERIGRTAVRSGAGQVRAEDVRGLQIGRGNHQLNVYTFDVQTPKIDLAARLEDPDVIGLVHVLACDPTDERARQRLITAIAPGGWGLGGPRSHLRITTLRSGITDRSSLFDGFTIFADVQGVQVGDNSRQRNEFVYTVAPTGSGRDLLQDNPGLARALVNCACPLPGGGSQSELNRQLQESMAHLPLRPGDGVQRSVHVDAPGPGQTLTIRRADGVSVGPNSRVEQQRRIRAAAVWARRVDRQSAVYTTGVTIAAAASVTGVEASRITSPGFSTGVGP